MRGVKVFLLGTPFGWMGGARDLGTWPIYRWKTFFRMVFEYFPPLSGPLHDDHFGCVGLLFRCSNVNAGTLHSRFSGLFKVICRSQTYLEFYWSLPDPSLGISAKEAQCWRKLSSGRACLIYGLTIYS